MLEEVSVYSRYKDPGQPIEPTLHKYFCVDAMRINYTPISLDEITKRLGQENWVKPRKSINDCEKKD
jgi:hypothetical protein